MVMEFIFKENRVERLDRTQLQRSLICAYALCKVSVVKVSISICLHIPLSTDTIVDVGFSDSVSQGYTSIV